MNAWYGLVKKEYRLSRSSFLLGLILLGIALVLFYFMGIRFNESGIVIAPTGMLIGLHVFYLTIFMIFSLNTEAKQLHLWLHNPQPAWMLLSAKLVNGIVAMIVSLSLAVLFFLYVLNEAAPNFNEIVKDYVNMGLFGLSYLIGISIYMAMSVLFIWTVNHTLKTRMGKFGSFIAFSMILLPTIGMGKFQSTRLYELLTNWGEIDLSFLFNFIPTQGMAHVTPHVYIGGFVFYLLLIIGLFFFSCWLIDRKVEV